ncbi:MAG: carbamoyltransferase [Gammaproteobacteria bacterium]|nr:carbamoyltransferase [Gammaproteobacteria bacterium]
MKMKKNYIGIANTPHDPAIAIINSKGELVFAEAAERYLQNKRAWGNPPDDLMRISTLIEKYCDPDADLVISTSWRRSHLRLLHFIMFGPLNQSLREYLGKTLKGYLGVNKFSLFKAAVAYMNPRVGINTEYGYLKCFPNQKVGYKSYDHHLTHAASACYSSSFDEALCAVIDGQGEKTNASFYFFKNNEIKKITKARTSDASLGEFYSLICIACGFNPLKGEEWKVMGLSPYGKLNQKYYNMLRPFMKVDGLNLRLNKDAYQKIILWLNAIKRKPEIPAIEYADLAFTGQYIFSEIMNELLNNLSRYADTRNLVLSGGCVLNSAYVGSITQTTSFKNSYIFCAPADDGNAVGAAWLAYGEDNQFPKQVNVCSPYLGTSVSPTALDRLKKYSALKKLPYKNKRLEEVIAEQLADGKIVGWMQGRAEFGPRALGNRSILADPRNPKVKEHINDTVKFREEFRPFAPSILHEFGDQYFEHYQYTPYMERTLRFKAEITKKVPGVVHVDGTGRLQSVKSELNPRYYKLIDEFYKITGVPILLNTSFNVMGKPIIHSVEDAVATFLTSGIDLLVIDDQIFYK